MLLEECNFFLEQLHALSVRKPVGTSDGSCDERHDPYAHKYLQLGLTPELGRAAKRRRHERIVMQPRHASEALLPK